MRSNDKLFTTIKCSIVDRCCLGFLGCDDLKDALPDFHERGESELTA